MPRRVASSIIILSASRRSPDSFFSFFAISQPDGNILGHNQTPTLHEVWFPERLLVGPLQPAARRPQLGSGPGNSYGKTHSFLDILRPDAAAVAFRDELGDVETEAQVLRVRAAAYRDHGVEQL